jgi:putative CRISPR-associated protein (TIGR02619 family)
MVSTCGTSLLTNGRDAATSMFLRRTANLTMEGLTPEQIDQLDELLGQARDQLANATLADARGRCAELNGLLGYYNNQYNGHQADQHILIHTDTYQGQEVAKLLEQYLGGQPHLIAHAQHFRDLRTDTLANFQHGLAGVIEWCHNTLPGYREDHYRVVFNLTGGFKSIQGWMQTLGMFYADEIIYIFESGGELLRIPKIPVGIDAAAQEHIRNHLGFFRKLAPKGATCQAADRPQNLPESFYYSLDGEVELSPWGRIVWNQVRPELYRENLLAPPLDNITFSQGFRNTAGECTPDQKFHINERLDDLAQYIQNQAMNPDRLNVRHLRGNPMPPSTHEFNAWAAAPGWRVFFHIENGRYVLDHLAAGLH